MVSKWTAQVIHRVKAIRIAEPTQKVKVYQSIMHPDQVPGGQKNTALILGMEVNKIFLKKLRFLFPF